jgi:hypothetical protein
MSVTLLPALCKSVQVRRYVPMKETCYMCDEPSVSKEHTPPKCVFPSQKDSNGTDYRKKLITVPSCDIHNSAKSKDDEYLMMVLTSYFNNNQAAQDQIKSKIARAWAKSPGLSATVVKNLRTLITHDGEKHAYEVDTSRFDRSLEWAANGLYRHVFGKRIDPHYKVISYPLVQLEGSDGAEVNMGRAKILGLAGQLFDGLTVLGGNPDIFWFQVSPVVDGRSVVRMCFFQSFQVIAMSSVTLET